MSTNCHKYETIKFKKIEGKKVAFLGELPLLAGEKLEVILKDGHKHCGRVITQEFCCDGQLIPFMPVNYHGEKPWVYLVEHKARRI